MKLLFTFLLSAQYNYGLEVEQHDAKIEGKLNLEANGSSVIIGNDAGINDDGTNNENVFLGHKAGELNTEGTWNTFIGFASGFKNTTGDVNTFIGKRAGSANVSGDGNVYVGYDAGLSNIQGGNVFLGTGAGAFSSVGNSTFIGTAAGQNTSGELNTFVGWISGQFNTLGSANTYLGVSSGNKNVEGNSNTYIGTNSGANNEYGSGNTFLGDGTGIGNEGSDNVILGYLAGTNNLFGATAFSGNIFIGSKAGSEESNSNRLYIENSSSTAPLIYGEFDTNKAGINWDSSVPLPATFAVNGTASKTAAGDWLANSDARLKKNIEYLSSKSMLDKVTQMKAVSYEWNDNTTGYDRPKGLQYGFIAQDLQQVWPENVIEDTQGYLQTAYGTYDHMYVEAIKELDKKYEKIKQENEMLKDELKAIKEMLQTMVSK